MEVSSRQIFALAAPTIIAYLTWSAVGGQVNVFREVVGTASVGTSSASKRPEIAKLVRNPFAPTSESSTGSMFSDLLSKTNEKEARDESPFALNGTVISPRWRMAIINGERVFEGQRYHGLRVDRISDDAVDLVADSGHVLHLTLDVARPAPGNEPKSDGLDTELTPFQRGLQAIKKGGQQEVLEALGIPRS